jgi:hypothetical protein
MRESSREQRFLETAASRGLRPTGRSHVEKTLRELSSFFSRSMFREETARRPGILQRVDPRARLLATLVFLGSVSIARSIPELLAHAALPIIALALSRIRPEELLGSGFLIAVAFATLMAAPATLNVFFDGTVVVPLLDRGREWRYGPYFLPSVIGITREGLLTAATFLLRVLSSVAAVFWLTLSTRWADLLRALRFLRLPKVFLQVIGMTALLGGSPFRKKEPHRVPDENRGGTGMGRLPDRPLVGKEPSNDGGGEHGDVRPGVHGRCEVSCRHMVRGPGVGVAHNGRGILCGCAHPLT